MKQVVLLLVILMACVLVAMPLHAQEVTPEPPVVVEEPPPAAPPVVNATDLFTTALIVIGAIVGIAFGVFGYIVRPAIVGAVSGMPQWAGEVLFSAGDTGLASLEGYAEGTEGTRDDDEVAKLRREFDQLRAEIRAKWEQRE